LKRLICLALALGALTLCGCEREERASAPVSSAISVLEAQLQSKAAPRGFQSEYPDAATYFSELFAPSKSPAK